MFTSALLTLYNHLGLVAALATLVITIILSNTQEANKVRRKIFAICLTSACLILTLICCLIHKTYSVVPDIYGATYDDALNLLRIDGLDGRLALASTNKDLKSADTRVVWQSCSADTVVERNSVVFFVIDDSFSTEYIPLVSDNLPESKSTWDWMKSGETASWDITMPLTDVAYEANTYSDSDGRALTTIGGYIFDLYSEPMSAALFEIADETCKQYANEMDIGQMQYICKLIPNKPTTYKLNKIISDDASRISLLPALLSEGDYRFIFCFNTWSGESYQWEHNIRIVQYEEWMSLIKTKSE